MLVHLSDGLDVVIDYRETAPRAATAAMYLDAAGEPVAGSGSSTIGWRASGVPGTVAGFAMAWKEHGSGKISWSDLIEPARRLAAEGHEVSQGTALSLRS